VQSRRGGLYVFLDESVTQTHSRSIANLEPGEHACCFYASETEHQAVVTPFLRQGLEQARKVLYVWDSHPRENILGYLHKDGLDPGPYVDGGQLGLLNVQDIAARQRLSGPSGAVDWLRTEVERALSEGYPELWITSEMTWALWKLPNEEGLAQYEAALNGFISSSQCVCLCQYDRRRFGQQMLMNALKQHPVVAIGPGIYDNTAALEQARSPVIA
jgi:hypothetical protein